MTVVLPRSVMNARKKVRELRPVKPSRADALNYFNQLNTITRDLLSTSDTVQQLIERGADATQIANELEAAHRAQIQKYLGMSAAIASSFVESLSESNKTKVERTLQAALGVDRATTVRTKNAKTLFDDNKFGIDLATVSSVTPSPLFGSINSVMIFDDPAIVDIVQASILENTLLIRSIAPHYFSLVAKAVSANVRGEPQVGGMTLVERLEDIGGITENRARFIARDQTAKVTSDLTRARHEAVGIKKYKWRNSRDERVVGNPSGRYPKGNKGHGNHWVREGVVYSYNNPPSDGNPGRAYNCRCTAEAVFDLDDIDAVFAG